LNRPKPSRRFSIPRPARLLIPALLVLLVVLLLIVIIVTALAMFGRMPGT